MSMFSRLLFSIAKRVVCNVSNALHSITDEWVLVNLEMQNIIVPFAYRSFTLYTNYLSTKSLI